MRDIFIFKQFESLYICELTSSKKIHSVNMASKLSFFFCILLVSLAVDSFWSSNTQVMALRDLPLLEEAVQVIKQVVLPDLLKYYKGCNKPCNSHADCNYKGGPCTQCRLKYGKRSKFTTCQIWKN
ncbi:fruit-specific protein-like [Lycium barbarum]|uniref:fruit-specific protein-like n=1 Tax=Lycium barbarum TaxID=112863 RepID=UPI00293EB45E|nr:fruit-specific protein-like [Lycium barbarum]